MISEWPLPSDWTWTHIEGIAASSKNSIVDGPFGSNLKTSDYIDDGIPVLQGKNITNNIFRWFDVRFISEDKAEELKRSAALIGDILIVKIGSIGYAAELDDLNGYPFAIIPANLAKLTIDESKVNKGYLLHWLASQHVSRHFSRVASKTAQPALSLGKIKELPVPLPPLAEQKRIAAILDKADAIRRKRQQAIQLADDFLRAVFLDIFGDPVTNPKGWEIKELREIAKIQIGPFGTQLHKEDYVDGGIPLINPTHIVKGHIVPKSDLSISLDKHSELPEYHLRVGDIVMGRRGEMGRCAVVTEKEHGWLCGTGSIFIRPRKSGVFSEYLNKFISSEAIKSHLESESLGATMPNLNKKIVGDIKVPVPSESVLEKFAKVKQMALALKAMHCEFNDDLIFESISQKAFRGEL